MNIVFPIIIIFVGQTYHEHARLPSDRPNVRSVAFSPDGRFLASLELGGILKLWDVESARHVATFPEQGSISSFAFAARGSRIAIGSLKSGLFICEFDKTGFKQVASRQVGRVSWLAFSPAQDEVIAVSLNETIPVAPGVGRHAAKLALIDAKSLETIRSIPCDNGMITGGIWFSPDGKRLAFTGLGLGLFVEDLASGTRKTFSFPKDAEGTNDSHPPIYSVAFSSDGKLIACGSYNKTARIWRLDDATLFGTLEGHRSSVMSILFIENDQLIATGSYDSSIKIWRTHDCREIQSINNQTASVTSMSYSSRDGLIASGSTGKDVILWVKDK